MIKYVNCEALTRESFLGLFKCWFELRGIICSSVIHLTGSHFSHKNYFGFGGLAALSVA